MGSLKLVHNAFQSKSLWRPNYYKPKMAAHSFMRPEGSELRLQNRELCLSLRQFKQEIASLKVARVCKTRHCDIPELPKKVLCIWGNAADHTKKLMLNQSQRPGHCNDLADLLKGNVNLK